MICAECAGTGQKSRVNIGASVVTCMGWSSYFDEEGLYHSHDPNHVTTAYHCSNGHSWSGSKLKLCPTIGCEYGTAWYDMDDTGDN